MPQIDLLNQYEVEKASANNQSFLLNMYLEEEQTTRLSQYPYKSYQDPPKGKYKVIAYPTWGLTTFCDTAKASVRGLFEHNDILYAVAGNTFYSINSSGVKTSIGTLNTSTGPVKISSITGGNDTNNQIIIIDGTNGYQYNVTTAVVDFPIADPDFFQTSIDLITLDDYAILAESSSIHFFISNIADATTYDALDFASKIRKSDKLMGIAEHKGELWLFGSKTTEVWQDAGNANFPFERRSDIFLEIGCAAKRSIVETADGLFFLAKSRDGGYSFATITSYQVQTMSTKAVMTKLSSLTTVSDCYGYAYSRNGHHFIDWTFPTDNFTFAYDLSNDTWMVRSSLTNSVQGAFLGSCAAFCYGQSFLGDSNSGKIYTQTDLIYTENGAAITRQLTTPVLYKEGRRIYLNRLQIDVQTNVGANKTFLLEMSTDAGVTWQSIDTYTIPTDGTGQIYTTSLGSAYQFNFRLTTTDNYNFCILGFIADAAIGEN